MAYLYEEFGKIPKKPKKAEAPRPVTAKGSLTPRKMNGTETAYSQYLELLRHTREILWWDFEAITFRLGDDCRLIPDFVVMLADGTIEIHDTKAVHKGKSKPHVEDDAAVKMRAAAERYPFRFFSVYRETSTSGWVKKEY